ncbi:hypothetical protein RND81_07G036700 [Saponaria officinalis]|uniref:Uncharacterized protein n=1 Tax=Saponaria officinalis TaxID=3572 RepID=A0AAW1JMK9_SAPOF
MVEEDILVGTHSFTSSLELISVGVVGMLHVDVDALMLAIVVIVFLSDACCWLWTEPIATGGCPIYVCLPLSLLVTTVCGCRCPVVAQLSVPGTATCGFRFP